MRMIFSTVLGPHEPALTVGPLAVTEAGRPAIVPEPVTTPSAPSPSSCQLARSPSSTNEPSSRSRSTRSRTGSFPCSAALTRWRSGPPDSARSRADWTSVMPANLVPVDRTRDQRVRAERAPEDPLGLAGGLQQRVEVHAGLDAHLVQHRDEVLGGDVAGGALRHRAAAELAEARLVAGHARLQRGEDVGQPLATRVVEVRGQLDVGSERFPRQREELAHLAGIGHAGGIAEADLLRTGADEAARDREDALGRHVALVGAAKADADHALAAQPGVAGAREDALQALQRLLDRAVDVLAVVRVAGAQEDVDLVDALAQPERILEAALVGDEDADADVVGNVRALEDLAAVGELRNDVRADEARHLQPLQPGPREHLDEPDLVVGGDDLRLVLEPVARADLADADALREVGHRRPILVSVACRSTWRRRLGSLHDAPLMCPDADGALALEDLDVEAPLAAVDDLAQRGPSGALRALRVSSDVLD